MKVTERIVILYFLAIAVAILATLFRTIDFNTAVVLLAAWTLMLAVYFGYPSFARNWSEYKEQKASPEPVLAGSAPDAAAVESSASLETGSLPVQASPNDGRLAAPAHILVRESFEFRLPIQPIPEIQRRYFGTLKSFEGFVREFVQGWCAQLRIRDWLFVGDVAWRSRTQLMVFAEHRETQFVFTIELALLQVTETNPDEIHLEGWCGNWDEVREGSPDAQPILYQDLASHANATARTFFTELLARLDQAFAPPQSDRMEFSESKVTEDTASLVSSTSEEAPAPEDQGSQSPAEGDFAAISTGIRVERRLKPVSTEALERLVRDWTRIWLPSPNHSKSPFDGISVQWAEDDNLIIKGEGEESVYLILLRPTYLDDVMKLEAVSVDWKTEPKIDAFVREFFNDLLEHLAQWLTLPERRAAPSNRLEKPSSTLGSRSEEDSETSEESVPAVHPTDGALKPWEKIPDHKWDREVLREWWAGYTCEEIAHRTRRASADRIRNRLTELRQEYGANIVPYNSGRKQPTEGKTEKQDN